MSTCNVQVTQQKQELNLHTGKKCAANREKIQDILNSFACRISYNDNDFSSCSGRIVGIFTGHYHGDTMNSSLFYQSSIVNALASKDNYTQGKAEIYDRTLGTTTEIAFDVVIIGKDTGKVNYIRFGAGNDRTIPFRSN